MKRKIVRVFLVCIKVDILFDSRVKPLWGILAMYFHCIQ